MNWCFLFQCFLLGVISEINPIKLHKMCKTCTATILLRVSKPTNLRVSFPLSSLPYQWKGFISFYFILAQNLSKVLSSLFCDYISISVIILHHDFNYLHFKDLCTWMSLLYDEMMVPTFCINFMKHLSFFKIPLNRSHQNLEKNDSERLTSVYFASKYNQISKFIYFNSVSTVGNATSTKVTGCDRQKTLFSAQHWPEIS